MIRNPGKWILFLLIATLWGAGCSGDNLPFQDSVEVDIEATIAAGIAATQEVQALSAELAGLPESPDSLDEPDPTFPPAATPIPESTPTAVPTRPDMNPPLLLPFTDNFDEGLRSEWRLINGRPLVNEGRLTSATGELSIEIGNTSLTNYILELDVGGKNACNGTWSGLSITFSPTLRFSYSNDNYWGNNYSGGELKWYTFDSRDWVQIDRQNDIACGRFEIDVSGNRYHILINGSLASDLIFEPAQGPLLIRLDEGVFIDNLVIR